MLKELVERGTGPGRPILFLSPITPTKDTEWEPLYPSGFIIHCKVLRQGLGRPSEGSDWRCRSARCMHGNSPHDATQPIPSDWPAPPGSDLRLLGEHHADVIITDNRDAIRLGKLDKYVAVHGTTPVFHPNIGDPMAAYCLGAPKMVAAKLNLGWFLDQFLSIVSWHEVNEHHVRDRSALAYWHALEKAQIHSIDRSVYRPQLYQHGDWRR